MYMYVSMTSGLRMKYFSFCRVAMASTPPSKRNASGPSFIPETRGATKPDFNVNKGLGDYDVSEMNRNAFWVRIRD